MRGKRGLVLLLSLVLLFIFTTVVYAQLPIRIFVDGKIVVSDTSPVLMNGRVMVPLRTIAEAMGADVEWKALENRVLITSPEPKTIMFGKEKTTWPYWIEDGELYLEYHNALEFIRECNPHPNHIPHYFKTGSQLDIGGITYTVPYLDRDGYRLISLSYLQRQRAVGFTWDPATATLAKASQ